MDVTRGKIKERLMNIWSMLDNGWKWREMHPFNVKATLESTGMVMLCHKGTKSLHLM